MKPLIIKLLAVFALLVGMTSASLALPACPSSGYKNNCFGTQAYSSGDKYVGEYKGNKRHGQGTYTYGPKSKWAGDKYVGEYKDGKRHGQGTYTWGPKSKWAGDKHVGEYKDGKMYGQGTYTYGPKSKWAGDKHIGEYKDGKRHGQGTYTWGPKSKWAGDKYVGEYKDGKRHGQGTYTYANGSQKKEGIWKNSTFQYAKKGSTISTPSSSSSSSDHILKSEFNKHRSYDRKRIQRQLNFKGYYTGSIDGIWGVKTKSALKEALTNLSSLSPINMTNSDWVKKAIYKILIGSFSKVYVYNNSSGYSNPSDLSNSSLCKIAVRISGGKLEWTPSPTYKKYIKEAKSRGLTCGVNTSTTTNSTAKTCKDDPTLCTVAQLCTKASHYSGGKKAWRKDYSSQKYVTEAKKNGLPCGVKVKVAKVYTCNDSPNYCSASQLCSKASHYSGGKKAWRNDYSSKKYVTEAKKNELPCGVKVVVKKEKPVDNKTYKVASGTGFYVSNSGHIITNHHVIEGCRDMKVISKGRTIETLVLASDRLNDLALLRAKEASSTYFSINNRQPEALEDIIVAGFPFGDRISSSIKFTQGIVSSLTGVGDNYSQIQIDAALQPGNSGGPIMDYMGNIVGVAVAKLSLKKIMDDYGVVPENTNFGIKASAVRNLMVGNSLTIKEPNGTSITKKQLAKLATDATVFLTCWMTMAQIDKAIKDETGKVLFKEFQK